jgi:predicted PhzF superfamily epimerase YddE/YHI9
MQEIDFYLVDAFSSISFGGNPAAVCPLKAWLPDETLLRMAQQHNQSETAFLSAATAALNYAGLPRSPKSISAATPRLLPHMSCSMN